MCIEAALDCGKAIVNETLDDCRYEGIAYCVGTLVPDIALAAVAGGQAIKTIKAARGVPSIAPILTRSSTGFFGSNVTRLRLRTSGGFFRDAGNRAVQVFQAAGGLAEAERLFTSQVGRLPSSTLATDVAEVGGLRYKIRSSSRGVPTVEIFDPIAATVEKVRFLE